MSYKKSENIYFENFLKPEIIHKIEDFLRVKLLSGKRISYIEAVIYARILWGRLLNSTKSLTKKLDPRHSKAQMMSLICLFFNLIQCKDQFLINESIQTQLYSWQFIKPISNYFRIDFL